MVATWAALTYPGKVYPYFSLCSRPRKLIICAASTGDGPVFDVLRSPVPPIIDGTAIKAADGLFFGTCDALLGYRNGVTSVVTAPDLRSALWSAG
jgi:hypothetical protein